MTKRVLITGGAGFIGGALIRRLLLESDFIIFNLDKLGYSSDITSIENIIKESKEINSRYNFLNINLSHKKSVEEVIKKVDPDLIIHLAAESHVDRSIDDPSVFIESNIIGTFNLLEVSSSHFSKLPKERKKNFRFQHISTDEVYGSLEDDGYFSENTNYNPRSPYSASKAASDHLVNCWYHTYGLPILITNCSNNYGPWQFPEKLIPLSIIKAIKNQPIPLYGDGKNIRDWLFVEDHIDAIMLVSSKGKVGSNYCVGGNNEKTNKDILNKICFILEKKLSKKNRYYSNLITHVNDRPGHDKRYAIDSSKIKSELGWTPKYSFAEGLEITVEWYIRNLDWCEKIQKRNSYFGERLGLNKNI